MADFKYHVPDPPPRKFAKGDKVTVVDSQGLELSTVTVTIAGSRMVKTDCGRQWLQDGRWVGDGGTPRPFPTIKLIHEPIVQ